MGGVISGVTDGLGLTNKSGDAALRAQQEATDKGIALQGNMYNQSRADMQPWQEVGRNSLQDLNRLVNGDGSPLTRSFTLADFQQDPGYQFRMDQGQKALERSAAARGGLNSGATMKALARYGQDYASNEYQNAYNRFNNDRDQRFNKLMSLSGMGQNASGQMGGTSMQFGQQVGDMYTNMGNAAAANSMAKMNRMGNTISQGARLGATALMACDINLKTDIEPISRHDLRELRKTLKAYRFKYKDDSRGEGEWVGIMAQDLEKTALGKKLVVTDEHGFKHIDAQKMLSMFLAAFAAGGTK